MNGGKYKYETCPMWLVDLHLAWLWRWWKYRHLTKEEEKERIAEKKIRFREAWEHTKEVFRDVPEGKELMEVRNDMDKLIEEICGPEPSDGKKES
jgi:hypothetical protein